MRTLRNDTTSFVAAVRLQADVAHEPARARVGIVRSARDLDARHVLVLVDHDAVALDRVVLADDRDLQVVPRAGRGDPGLRRVQVGEPVDRAGLARVERRPVGRVVDLHLVAAVDRDPRRVVLLVAVERRRAAGRRRLGRREPHLHAAVGARRRRRVVAELQPQREVAVRAGPRTRARRARPRRGRSAPCRRAGASPTRRPRSATGRSSLRLPSRITRVAGLAPALAAALAALVARPAAAVVAAVVAVALVAVPLAGLRRQRGERDEERGRGRQREELPHDVSHPWRPSQAAVSLSRAEATPRRRATAGAGAADMTSTRWPAGQRTNVRGASHALLPAVSSKPASRSAASVAS